MDEQDARDDPAGILRQARDERIKWGRMIIRPDLLVVEYQRRATHTLPD